MNQQQAFDSGMAHGGRRRTGAMILRRHVKEALASRLGWKVAARCLRAPGITVLMYHRITRPGDVFPGMDESRFRSQMQWLERNCWPIYPEQFAEAMRLAGRRRSRPPVLVTFDDGYRDYHDRAYGILQELRIPSIVFLATGLVDEGGMLWTDTVTFAIRAGTRDRVRLPWDPAREHRLESEQARLDLERSVKSFLKGVPDEDRQRWQAQLLQALGFDDAEPPVERQMLSWSEVRAMTEFTRFGGHTHNHPILSRIAESVAEDEIARCRARIVEELGTEPRYFAYPNGRACDFTEHTRSTLERNGFELGFTTIPGVHQPGMDPFLIRRQPTAARCLGDFASIVAGR